LPYPDPGQVVAIADRGDDGSRVDLTFGTYRELAARAGSLQAIAVMRSWRPTLQGSDQPERLEGQLVSAEYFEVLGVVPTMGRAFQGPDDQAGGPRVVILSDGLWRRRFNADPGILGRSITLDDDGYLVIGVMPPGFENVPWPSADLWGPLQYDMSEGRAWGHHLRGIGRVRKGLQPEAADRELAAVASSPVAEFPRPAHAALPNGFILATLQEDATRGIRPVLLAMLGAVILVLVIAVVNVTNLLLAWAVRRRGEFALRAALGAGHHRLVRQSLTASLLLAVIGGAVGMGVAVLGVRGLVALSPAGLPRAASIGVDGAVFAPGSRGDRGDRGGDGAGSRAPGPSQRPPPGPSGRTPSRHGRASAGPRSPGHGRGRIGRGPPGGLRSPPSECR
jgi:putative ABC transport system permease protein